MRHELCKNRLSTKPQQPSLSSITPEFSSQAIPAQARHVLFLMPSPNEKQKNFLSSRLSAYLLPVGEMTVTSSNLLNLFMLRTHRADAFKEDVDIVITNHDALSALKTNTTRCFRYSMHDEFTAFKQRQPT